MLKANVEYEYCVYIDYDWIDREYHYWNYEYVYYDDEGIGEHEDVPRYAIQDAVDEFARDASEYIKKNINKLTNLPIDITNTSIDSSPFTICFKLTEDINDEDTFKELLDNIFNYEGVYHYDIVQEQLCLIFVSDTRRGGSCEIGKSSITIKN